MLINGDPEDPGPDPRPEDPDGEPRSDLIPKKTTKWKRRKGK